MGIGKHDHSLFLILCYVIPTGGVANISRPLFLRANNVAHFSLLRVRICTTKLCQNQGKSDKHLQGPCNEGLSRTYETADHVSSAPRYVREKGTSELMVVFTDAKRSSNPFTLSSVKKDTLSLVVATGVVLSDALMGG